METKERLMFKYALGGIVLSTSLHTAAALSLGGASGQAIIGHPLDMQVRSSMPLADIESAGCLQAEVKYGDTRLPAGSVSLSVQGTADGAVIRVRSSVPVNEPLVSVVLNAGCAADRYSRQYTLLADIDPALAPAPSVAAVPLVVLSPPAPARSAAVTTPPLPAASMSPASAPGPVAAPSRKPEGAQAAAQKAVEPRPAPARKPAAVAPADKPRPAKKRVVPTKEAPPQRSAPAATPPTPAASGPRLKLDPIDLSPGRNPGLKLNTELSAPPSATETERQAASELWAALNTPPEKAAQDARRLATMEAELKALREQQASLQASMTALTAQMQAERDERAPNWLLYALGAALALAAAALAWLLTERRRLSQGGAQAAGPWWQSSQGPDSLLSAAAQQPPAEPSAPAVSATAAPAPGLPDSDFQSAAVHVQEATESSFAQFTNDAPLSVEVLLDLVQQVEFFESLQQHGDAALVLEQFIEEHPSACELPYLLLMRQAQARGDTARLTALGARYQAAFGALPPDAANFAPGVAGLDAQAKFMDVLSRFWPGEQVLGLLRNTLMAAPGTGLLERHSLQAYEDALLLYGVAHTLLIDPDLPNPGPGTWAEPVWNEPVVVPPSAAPEVAPAPLGNGLDLDLSFTTEHDVPAPAEPPASAPDEGKRELPMLDFDLFALDDKNKPPPTKP